jgi:L-fuculose-phosphate aldolase
MSGEVPPGASSEYRVHRAVYHATDCKAIIHAHPPYAIACSLRYDQIVPVDSEGLMFTPLIPVVDGACGSEELASRVACSLAAHSIVVARGHGTFAAGISLDAAYLLTSAAEHSCQILYLAGTTRTR